DSLRRIMLHGLRGTVLMVCTSLNIDHAVGQKSAVKGQLEQVAARRWKGAPLHDHFPMDKFPNSWKDHPAPVAVKPPFCLQALNNQLNCTFARAAIQINIERKRVGRIWKLRITKLMANSHETDQPGGRVDFQALA